MTGAAVDVGAMKDVLVVLGTAGVVVPLMHRLKVGSVLGFLMAGALLGPHGLGRFAQQIPPLSWITVADVDEIAGIADFGVVFLLFVIGLEISVSRLMALKRLVFGLGPLQLLLSTVAIAAIAVENGTSPSTGVVLGACLSLSSTAVVIEVLAEKRRLTSVTGRTTFAVLLFQDLAVIPILFVVEAMGSAGGLGGSIWLELALALAKGIAAVAAIVVVGRLALRPLFRVVAETRSAELFTAATLFVAIGTGVATAAAGMSMALGAFVAGQLLAETEYRRAIEATIEPFKGLLLGVFFFSVGMKVDLDFAATHVGSILLATLALVGVKGLITGVGARLFGVPPTHAVKTALLIGPGGEFAFILVAMAQALHLVDAATTTFVIAVVSLSMASIPFFDLVGVKLSREIDRRLTPAPETLVAPPEDHAARAVIVGFGRVGRVVGAMLDVHRIPWLAVDLDADNVVQGRRAGHPVYFGDVTNPLFLRTCGIATASVVIVTMHRSSAVDAVVDVVKAERTDVAIVARARDADHARSLYRRGVTDAVPETIEASLQLSEAVLVDLGVPMGPIIASIHEKRDEFRKTLTAAAKESPNASETAKRGLPRARRPLHRV